VYHQDSKACKQAYRKKRDAMKELEKDIWSTQGRQQALLTVVVPETVALAGTVHMYKEINDEGMVFLNVRATY
jgi:hypothetical protein